MGLPGLRRRRVLQHPDQEHAIEAFVGFEAKQIVDEDANIGKVAAAFGSNPSARQATVNGDHFGADLAKVARDRAAAQPNSKTLLPGGIARGRSRQWRARLR